MPNPSARLLCNPEPAVGIPEPAAAALTPNGIDATTGLPLAPGLTLGALVRRLGDRAPDGDEIEDFRRWRELQHNDHLDVRYGIDPCKLEQSGWGVIVPAGAGAALEALKPLLRLRREQAGDLYRELEYRPGESKHRFLARHGVGPGPVDPRQLPYYLLIVGGPGGVPFSFQYQLDVQYAVGRLDLAAPEHFAHYAHGVLAVERGEVVRPPTATLFGVANEDDPATRRSLSRLVEPLACRLEATAAPRWSVERLFGGEATKAALAGLLGGDRSPALVLTAGHGAGFPAGDPRQLAHQGALICQDWPGPRRWSGPLVPAHYLGASDVVDGASPAGLIAMTFACFGAGTPRLDSFDHDGEGREIAPRDFVAGLPRRLLGHPKGGALAVIGHVDRAWSYSFDWSTQGRQLQAFESCFERLMDGYPVGAALEPFNQRYAELAVDLAYLRQELRFGAEPDYLELTDLWTAHNDARSYVVLGDPAVRAAVASPRAVE